MSDYETEMKTQAEYNKKLNKNMDRLLLFYDVIGSTEGAASISLAIIKIISKRKIESEQIILEAAKQLFNECRNDEVTHHEVADIWKAAVSDGIAGLLAWANPNRPQR